MNVSLDALSGAFDAFKSVVNSAVTEGHLPSAVFAVATREKLLLDDAVGPPDGATRPTAASIYLLASITKPIVATAMLRLVERGLIALDEPVANHWPEFAVNHKGSVTLWHLLTHTSGLDESYAERRVAVEGANLRDLDAQLVRDTFLSFEPGSRYRYCNAAFRVMAVLIEQLTGRSYDDFVRDEVLTPLGMSDTTFSPSAEQRERAMPVVDARFDLSRFVALALPSGGYWSTTRDLVAFGQMYLNGGRHGQTRVLGTAAVAAATRVQYEGVDDGDAIRPSPVYRGLGFSIVGPGRSGLVPIGTYGHGGATGTRLWIDPVHGLVIVFLTNRWDQDNRWRERALNAFYGSLED